jgi:hypothetical protein
MIDSPRTVRALNGARQDPRAHCTPLLCPQIGRDRPKQNFLPNPLKKLIFAKENGLDFASTILDFASISFEFASLALGNSFPWLLKRFPRRGHREGRSDAAIQKSFGLPRRAKRWPSVIHARRRGDPVGEALRSRLHRGTGVIANCASS